MPNSIDPMFLVVAHSIMKNRELPDGIQHCPRVVRNFFAKCLSESAASMSVDMGMGDITRVNFELVVLPHSFTDDINEEVESALEIAGVEVEHTPGSIAANASLNRFSGIDVNE